MSKRYKINQRRKCNCPGYWFPHRKGGGSCHHSTRWEYYAALKEKVPKEVAMELLSAADIERMFPLWLTQLK